MSSEFCAESDTDVSYHRSTTRSLWSLNKQKSDRLPTPEKREKHSVLIPPLTGGPTTAATAAAACDLSMVVSNFRNIS